jgi:N-acetylmuramoyl-L-alanine amidase
MGLFKRYRGRHLKLRPKRHGPVVVGTAAAVWAAAPGAQAATHVVSPGETLSGIATRYGTSVPTLAKRNNISNVNFIVSGTRLRVSGSTHSQPARHKIQPGETLSSIANRYGTSISKLARLNRLQNPNLIVAGRYIKVPGRASVPSAAPASASSASIEASLERQSIAHGVDPTLVKSVAYLESGWQQDVVSEAGAIGVMQVMPATARYVNRSLGGGNLNVRKADDNVHLGVMYLKHVIGSMGSEKKGLAAYYSGPGNVGSRLKGYQRWYVERVRELKSRW